MNLISKKLIGFSSISLIVLALFIWLAIFPLFGKIKELSQEYLKSQEVMVRMDQREFLFRDLEKSYQEKKEELDNIEGTFLTEKETVGFISTLEEIAYQTGNDFEIRTADFFAPEEQDKFLSLTISLTGDFESLLLFLANLEDSPYPPYRLLELDSLLIHRLEGDDVRDGDLETTLSVKVYTK